MQEPQNNLNRRSPLTCDRQTAKLRIDLLSLAALCAIYPLHM
jgi:hypothetical protein